jgi:hypothetical protein
VSSNTPKLGLFKMDPAVDGDKNFNIDTMLNGNWDKIDSVIETETGAQDKANVAEQNAKNYADLRVAEDKDIVRALQINLIDVTLELETLKGATLTGVTANMFVETFINLNDITLSRGTFDSTNQKVILR